MVNFPKPYLETHALLDHLASKGMRFGDVRRAKACLERIGYYRMSGYWHSFKLRGTGQPPEAAETFREATSFEDIADLYAYDSRLRLLVLAGVETIEVSLRVQIAELMGRRHAFAYLMPELLHRKFTEIGVEGTSRHGRWLETYERRMHGPQEVFVRHLLEKYGAPLPVWASVELWDFSQTCLFLSGMKYADRAVLASRHGVESPDMLQSWLKSIKGLRNHAAHHGRLWNRNLAAQPSLPDSGKIPVLDFINADMTRRRQARVGCPLSLMAYLIGNIDPTSAWPQAMSRLVSEFPSHTGQTVESMGFPRT